MSLYLFYLSFLIGLHSTHWYCKVHVYWYSIWYLPIFLSYLLHLSFYLQVRLHSQKSQLMSFCSFINEAKVWKNPTAQTRCEYPLQAPDNDTPNLKQFFRVSLFTNVLLSSGYFLSLFLSGTQLLRVVASGKTKIDPPWLRWAESSPQERRVPLTKSLRCLGQLTSSSTCRKQGMGKPTATLFSDHCLCLKNKLHYSEILQWSTFSSFSATISALNSVKLCTIRKHSFSPKFVLVRVSLFSQYLNV